MAVRSNDTNSVLATGADEYVGLFDLFKIGLGPSSSHTTGPMLIARAFAETAVMHASDLSRIKVRLLGSLASTGTGHHTPQAVILGLLGFTPDKISPELAKCEIDNVRHQKQIALNGEKLIPFIPADDIVLDRQEQTLPHPNTMILQLIDEAGTAALEEQWMSLGGGFIQRVGDNKMPIKGRTPPFFSGGELIELCERHNCSISDVIFELEEKNRCRLAVTKRIDEIADFMNECVDRGLNCDGPLPGLLGVKRRAKSLFQKFAAPNSEVSEFERISGLISAYAIAVNEENAAGHVVVTAPTNGAAGVVPAVLRYLQNHCARKRTNAEIDYFLAATAIGGLLKRNASISGAEVGCQGEVGSASAMAAAGLTAACGGTAKQVCHAAEIALEHHLGMTCDPIGGLVQIPCIERNAFGSIKAINASNIALAENGIHRVSLDQVIATMHQTGKDMRSEYRETSRGGLAVHVPIC